MEICIVGAGYVGLTTAAVLSGLGHRVCCVDRDARKIELLENGEVPIYEPGLEELVQQGRRQGTLLFSTDSSSHIDRCAMVMIAVGTPSAPDGTADLVYVKSALMTIGNVLRTHKTIIIKSTVPPGTGNWAHNFLVRRGVPEKHFDIVSNPEFLREGSAIQDTLQPDRIVVGASCQVAAERVLSLYSGIVAETVVTGRTEAELIKYGSNAFLATKLSFINELARVCDVYEADILRVAHGIGLDRRIGGQYLHAGIGYGGSCLPKDVDALKGAAAVKGLQLKLLDAVASVNETQLEVYLRKLEEMVGPLGAESRIAVWGAAFKENTDDTRYSRGIAVMERLAGIGCAVTAYDPLVSPQLQGVSWSDSALAAAEGADAVMVATGWPVFAETDWGAVGAVMRGDVIVDGRNMLDRTIIEQAGLRYAGVGRPAAGTHGISASLRGI